MVAPAALMRQANSSKRRESNMRSTVTTEQLTCEAYNCSEEVAPNNVLQRKLRQHNVEVSAYYHIDIQGVVYHFCRDHLQQAQSYLEGLRVRQSDLKLAEKRPNKMKEVEQ